MEYPNTEQPAVADHTDYPEYREPLFTGNIHDDDATVLENLFQENSDPGLPFPTDPGRLRPGPPAAVSRLLSGTVTLAQTIAAAPLRFLNADPNRVDLQIFLSTVTSAVLYAPVYLASDGGSFLTGSTSAAINAGQYNGAIDLGKHTGELWVFYPAGPATDVLVSWIATTK